MPQSLHQTRSIGHFPSHSLPSNFHSHTISAEPLLSRTLRFVQFFHWQMYNKMDLVSGYKYYEGIRAAWLARKSGQSYRHPFNVGVYKNITLVISRHLGWVRSIAFDPSNTWFCTGSADRTIKVVGWLVIVIMLPLVALTTQTASYVFTHFETAPESTGISNEVYVVILSFLTNQHSLHGYDAAAHPTEETKGADKNGLVVILSSIGIISVFGWAYILALTFSIQAPRKFSPGVTNEAVQNDAAVLKGSDHRHEVAALTNIIATRIFQLL